jgi:hypothetical protein
VGTQLCRILHACLARRARLNNFVSLIPSPPSYFGWIIASQETQLVLLFPYLHPHQNLRIIELICSHNPLGSLKHDIEYVGTAWATAFIRISFPPTESSCSIHPKIFFHRRSRRYLKSPLELSPHQLACPNISH